MRIAVINETSAADRNADILAALEGRGHQVINAGMKEKGTRPELTYIHTGFLAALLLNCRVVELVVGGCGTGQGFLNSAMQYPGVFCGHLMSGLDAWLFAQINAGNCVSLALNQGYGWAGDVNLRFIFERLFSVERGCGYPVHRKDSQRESRLLLERISGAAHPDFADVLERLPDEVVRPALSFPGIREMLEEHPPADRKMEAVLSGRFGRL